MAPRFEFDWDPAKAASNLAKHGVSFDEAMTVFLDPLALSQPDDEHGSADERWITIGLSRDTKLLLVVHTHVELDKDRTVVFYCRSGSRFGCSAPCSTCFHVSSADCHHVDVSIDAFDEFMRPQRT